MKIHPKPKKSSSVIPKINSREGSIEENKGGEGPFFQKEDFFVKVGPS